MKKIVYILIIFISSFACKTKPAVNVNNTLKRYDENLLSSFSLSDFSSDYLDRRQKMDLNAVCNSFDSLAKQDLNNANRAYLNLLKTYCMLYSIDGNNNKYISDSTIYLALDYYKKTEDVEKYARSLLLFSIVRYKNDIFDSLGRDAIMQAYSMSAADKINNCALQASIAKTAGDYYRSQRKWSDAISYYERSSHLYERCSDTIGIVLTKSYLSKIYQMQEKYDKSDSIFEEVKNMSVRNAGLRKTLYKYIISTYNAKKDYRQVIYYNTKRFESNHDDKEYIDSANYFLIMSKCYKEMQMSDSAYKYAKLCIKVADTSEQLSNISYLTNIADLSFERENFKDAAKYYRKIKEYSEASSYMKMTRRSERIKNIELEKKIEIEKRENLLNKIKSEERTKAIVYTSVALLLCCISILIITWLNHKRKDSAAKLNNIQLTHQILRQMMGLLPEFTSDLNIITNKSAKYSNELFESMNKILNKFKNNYRNNISSIVNSAFFLSQCPNLEYLTILSDQEKLIYFLFDKGYSSQEISTILGTTAGNIRASKSRIKSKILSDMEIPAKKRKSLLIFDKD